MALISRYLLEVSDEDFLSAAPSLFREWVAGKLRNPDLDLPGDGEILEVDGGSDVRVREAEADGERGFRGSYFEQRQDDQVRTTFTALTEAGRRWAWIDLERWSEDPFSPGWIPAAPRLLISIMGHAECRRGPTAVRLDYEAVRSEEGARVAAEVLDRAREIPIVVATPTNQELASDLASARERAEALQRALVGVAPVVLLEKGALASFSKEMHAAGVPIDVRGGAVRTYLPRIGTEGDNPSRHRLIPYARLRTRPADTAGRLVVLPLTRAAGQIVPPPVWTETLRDPLVIGASPPSDADLMELLELAEKERKGAERRAERAEEERWEAEQHLEGERESSSELLDRAARLSRRLEFAQGQIRKSGETPQEPADDIQAPEFCSEAVELAKTHCPGLSLGPQVIASAESLDEHAQSSWARKAWQTFRAMQAYVDSKHGGDENSASFSIFCERGLHSDVIPISWIAMGESESTDQNQAFRSLRTFPVPTSVDPSGRLYMPAHIKLEQGGYPAPRIHYHDDAEGPSRQIHVGWFGPHLDNKAKS